MPKAPRRPCPHPGCKVLIERKQRACIEHSRTRGNANQRGYNWQWRKASKAFLVAHPLCECPDCQAGAKRVTVATVVDHKIPHRGDERLFWDVSNWQAMSKRCHDKKTASGQ